MDDQYQPFGSDWTRQYYDPSHPLYVRTGYDRAWPSGNPAHIRRILARIRLFRANLRLWNTLTTTSG